jgi:diguanylate cyclase (GGDEF)-like protein
MAYAPIGDTGLGVAMTVPAKDLDGTGLVAMVRATILVLFWVGVGAWALRRSLRRLTDKLSMALRSAKDNLATFLAASESSQDTMWMLRAVRDAQGYIKDFKVVYANEAYLRMLRRARHEFVGRTMLDLTSMYPRWLEHFETYKQVTETGRPSSLESLSIAPGAEERWMKRQVTKMQDGVFVVARDVTEQVKEQETLREVAMLDDLTGLPNRRMFKEALRRACDRAAVQGNGVAVVFCDLDDFKVVNDRWGHAVGDELLIEFARALRLVVRHSDVVARLSGDEFVVLLENLTAPEEAESVVLTIRSAFRRMSQVSGTPYVFRVSVGFACAEGAKSSPEVLLTQADHAMYKDKAVRKKVRARHDDGEGARTDARIE